MNVVSIFKFWKDYYTYSITIKFIIHVDFYIFFILFVIVIFFLDQVFRHVFCTDL